MSNRGVHLISALALALVVWLVAHPSRAGLRPYFVLDRSSLESLRPKVIVVLDTSGSMGANAVDWTKPCFFDWASCETPGHPTESRMSIARRALLGVVDALEGTAEFALMTFEQYAPPTTVPPKCGHTSGTPRRFVWFDSVRQIPPDVTAPLDQYGGVTGRWGICSGFDASNYQRAQLMPYPYLRWDELGVGSVIATRTSTGAVPPSPLISTAPGDINGAANATRRVQWFPEFLGVRARLDSATDPSQAILARTVGDYGTASNMPALTAEVWGHDFYYWPYVDGFPGYGAWFATTSDPAITDPPPSGWFFTGVVRAQPATSATLYAPFFLDATARSGIGLAGAAVGPSSATAARDDLRNRLKPLIEGGLDAASGQNTPWASALGDANTVVPPADNRKYSHTTVASYVAMLRSAGGPSVCSPLAVAVVTDGAPFPATEGGVGLYARLSALRRALDVSVYVVGVFTSGPAINNMACAAAGACDGACSTPCDDTPAAAWDTCADPSNPVGACAFQATDAGSLQSVLEAIVDRSQPTAVPSGPGASLADFSGPDGDDAVRTELRAGTEFPQWRGTLERRVCNDMIDERGTPVLAPWCVAPADPPAADAPLGPCPLGWEWDAAGCVAAVGWLERRYYTDDGSGRLIRILDGSSAGADGLVGKSTSEFRALVIGMGLLPSDVAVDRFARFIQGKGWPIGERLAGLASAAPIVARRMPPADLSYAPAVPIADPHCAGRRGAGGEGIRVPLSLIDHARAAWSDAGRVASPVPHAEDQDLVLLGDDSGVLHAFQLQSGNELWGYLPSWLLPNALAQRWLGGAQRGQPRAVSDHLYGLAGTPTTAWVWDPGAARWRHLAVIGAGIGGTEYVALDVSHGSPHADRLGRASCAALPAGDGCPFEILWSTTDAALRADHDRYQAQSWARPGIVFEVPGNRAATEPVAHVLFGGGYGAAGPGEWLTLVDALTGQVERAARIPYVGLPGDMFDTDGAVVAEPAVASHCLSKFWPEMQRAYVADPAGRIFRWDLDRVFAPAIGHRDGGAPWILDGNVEGTAIASASFEPCMSSGGQDCAVGWSTFSFDPLEVFVHPPAVSAIDRIDDDDDLAGAVPPSTFLVALASGGASDDSTADPRASGVYHSSLYLLRDAHQFAPGGGFAIPAGGPKVDPYGAPVHAGYHRVAVSDLVRTRVFTPYPGAAQYTETRRFRPTTRPLRAPRIRVRAVVDSSGERVDGVEVMEVDFFLHEPGDPNCDPRFHDPSKSTWHEDRGASFMVTFRVTVDDTGLDFRVGSQTAANLPGARELTLVGVEQVRGGDCADGVCAPTPGAPGMAPCQVGDAGSLPSDDARAMAISVAESRGFQPTE